MASWDFSLDHLLIILDLLPAARLLVVAQTCTLWRDAAGLLLRRRNAEPTTMCTGMHESFEQLLGQTFRSWRYIPTLVIIFATDRSFRGYGDKKRKRTSRAGENASTRSFTDAASKFVPQSCTLVVLRTTGVIGQHVTDGPLEVENGEVRAMVSIFLAHFADGERMSWLGIGRDHAQVSFNAPECARCVLRCCVAAHAGAWWVDGATRTESEPLSLGADRERCHQLVQTFMPEPRECPESNEWHAGKYALAASIPTSTYTTGARLFVFKSDRLNRLTGDADKYVDWLLSEYFGHAKLLTGGIVISTAIRTGPRTRYGVRSSYWHGVDCFSSSDMGDRSGRAISVNGLVLALPPQMPMSTSVFHEDVCGKAKMQQALTMCLQREPKPPSGSQNHHLYDQNLLPDDVGLGLAYVASHSTPPEHTLPKPDACLVFTCNGRGAAHHLEVNAESGAVLATLPGVALAGAFLGGEFGPQFGLRNRRDESYSLPALQCGCQ